MAKSSTNLGILTASTGLLLSLCGAIAYLYFFLAGYHPEKGCLPVAVPADKPDPFSGVDRKTDIIKNDLGAVCFGKAADL